MSDEKCCGECENCTGDSVSEQIRLDQDVYEDLIELFVRKNMLPESYQVFNDYLASGSTLEDAATKAMLNDMANEALTTVIKEVNHGEALIAAGEAILKRYTFYKNNKKEDNNNDDSTTEEIPR